MSQVGIWALPKSLAQVQGQNLITFGVPAFSFNPTWRGASQLLMQVNCTSSAPFRFLNIAQQLVGVPFILVVRWKYGSTITRYSLNMNSAGVLYVPCYNNQLIPQNFSLEIWSTDTANISSPGITLNTSVFAYDIQDEDYLGFGGGDNDLGGTICQDLEAALPFNGTNQSLIYGNCSAGTTN